jgi:hypothetical protein
VNDCVNDECKYSEVTDKIEYTKELPNDLRDGVTKYKIKGGEIQNS